jgi:hypothetical protein
MKKPKISLDAEKIQAFFLHHIEKILLGVVLLLMVMLVLRGLWLPSLSKDLTPQGLVSKSESTRQYIDEPTRWTNEVSIKRMVPFDVVPKVQQAQLKTEPLAYALPNSLSRPDFPKLSPRDDPELFAPINLVVRPVIGALASYPRPTETEYTDPLYPTLSEEEIKKQKAARAKAVKAAKKAADLGGEYGPGGTSDGGMTGPGGRAAAKGRRGRPGQGEDGGYASEPGGRGGRGPGAMMMPGGPGGGYSGYGGEGGMAPGGIFLEATTFGYLPQDATNTIARDVASITLMAVVPFQKQIEEYEKKLSNSLDYDPKRDFPTYLDFRVQRADVTDLEPTAPVPDNVWQPLTAPQKTITELLGSETPTGVPTPGLYAGVPVEVVDPTYLSEVLTLPAPPYLQRDLWDLLTHPDVPLYTGMQYGEGLPGAAAAAPAPGDEDAPSLPMMRPGGPGGMTSDGGGYSGAGMPGMSGMRGGGMMGGRMPGGTATDGGYGGAGMRGGYSPMRSAGGYSPMRGSEDGGSGYGYGGMAQTYTPPKYQLVRLIDTHVERGHKYRYRIRLYLHDPNHPDTTMFYAPSAASLADAVRKRVKVIDDADAAKPKNQITGLPERRSWIVSPWSEPSPIAELPPAERVFTGKVSPERRSPIKNILVPAAEPSAEATALVFDHGKIADIPAHQDKVTRGSVLNFTLDKTKVIHPVTKEVIELEKYPVVTDLLVADLMGGETIRPVPTALATPQSLTALGEMLVVDSQGNLRVQNEAQDIENIRRFAVPKEDPAAAKAAAAAAAGTDGGIMPGDTVGGRRGAPRSRTGCF